MIIDAHGHYTTAPAALKRFRADQLSTGSARLSTISDDELRESVEPNQLRVMDQRGEDLMLLSPRASGMQHDVPDHRLAQEWARVNNDLVHRVCELYPNRFAPVAQLPQTPDGNLDGVLTELHRTVEQLHFVAVNLNPDPSGTWAGLPITDQSWFPIHETLQDLEVPAMIHVSQACNPNFHTLGSHYLNADTTVFMQLLSSDLFDRFPDLRLVIPHGGGAVPYHWGRYKGLAQRYNWKDPAALLRNVYFDTCVYHQAGMQLLTTVIPPRNLLFASEMFGAVRGTNPDTGTDWDNTLSYLNSLRLDTQAHRDICSANARNIYSRLQTDVRA